MTYIHRLFVLNLKAFCGKYEVCKLFLYQTGRMYQSQNVAPGNPHPQLHIIPRNGYYISHQDV